ncbi:sensor histidine kinase [Kribbella sp. VKM Ac-2566]|uniref:sensor histidine kinase n=1 Tax=Kribbella sp. VKM Ac-2566 TaxID=2512218 RepID=UPI0010634E0F|nr:histidine kinase [Kribbella sp. VKM Ac-2566]TDW86599.1 histidine kinase [Kribbella sp. VKM Ac-2566]
MGRLRRADRGQLTERTRQHGSTVGLLVRFTAAGVIVLLSLAALIAFVARQAGVEQATESARQVTYVTARGVVEPRLDAAVVDGEPAALRSFDAAMRKYVLQGSLVRVKLWNADGRIVYSDEPRLIGRQFPLGPEEQEALRRQGSSESEVSDLSRPENQFEIPYEKLLEVYVGVRGTNGEPMLFEAYFEYQAVTAAGQAAWKRFAPPSLGALLVLELVQIPFAWSLARRVQRQQQDRERLLQHAVDASDAERRRIAGELHDGVVQELTGLNYAFDAMRLGHPTDDQRAELIADGAGRLRASIGSLRSLLVDIYPPNLAEEGLASALAELAAGLERAGVEVRLETDGAEELPPAVAALLFRTAQEVVRNVAAHSGAAEVLIKAGRVDGRAVLIVDDDGRGFDESRLGERSSDGHLGLRSIGDLLAESGGTLTVRAAPGQGTRVEAEVPV